MTTPAKTSDVSAPAAPAYQPAPAIAPFGGLLIMLAGFTVVLSTWYMYPHTADGMWAGYRGGMVATAIVLASFVLRTSVGHAAARAVAGLGGALLILFALVYDDTTTIFVTELGGGLLVILGVLLHAAGRKA